MTGTAPRAGNADRAETQLSAADVERQLRELLGPDAGRAAKLAAVAAGVGAAAAAVASVYLLGRRKGRRRASVLEIRRV
jgi:hypothetical protein